MTYSDIQKRFAPYQDWQSRYRQLILLGKELPELNPTLDVEQLKGCESKLYYHIAIYDNHIALSANSDARIVNGLLYILVSLLEELTLTELENFDFNHYLKELGILQRLTSTRVSGLLNLINTIKSFASSNA